MKKTLLASSIFLALGTGLADAAFTPLPDGNYQMVITGGCFQFGGNCQSSGQGVLTDNTAGQASFTTTTSTNTTRAVGSTVGSGIVGDGIMGVIDFTLINGNLSVTSFSQDTYGSGGFFGSPLYLDAAGTAGTTNMTGSISGSGDMTYTPTGREAMPLAFHSSIGIQEWNRDDLGTGLYDTWTTGSSTNRQKGTNPPFTLAGSALQDTGTAGEWSGTLVSAFNLGTVWGFSQNIQYSEVYDVTITANVPPIGTACNVLILSSTYSEETNGDHTTVTVFTAAKIKGVPSGGFKTVTHTGPGNALTTVVSRLSFKTITQLRLDPDTFEIKSLGTCAGVANCSLQAECDSF